MAHCKCTELSEVSYNICMICGGYVSPALFNENLGNAYRDWVEARRKSEAALNRYQAMLSAKVRAKAEDDDTADNH